MDGMMGGGGYTPEQLQALMEYGVSQGAFTEQDRAIQQQLAQAAALRDRAQSHHTTGAGAMFGGIGDVLTQVAGQQQAKTQRAQDTALQQARIDALRKLAAAYGQQQPGAGFLGAP
jgi:hypothetical protein